MTQEELRNKLDELNYAPHEFILNTAELDAIMKIINQHVKEVIGEDDTEFPVMATENALRAEQRKRAGL